MQHYTKISAIATVNTDNCTLITVKTNTNVQVLIKMDPLIILLFNVKTIIFTTATRTELANDWLEQSAH